MTGWLYSFASDPGVTITAIWGPATREEADRRLIKQLVEDGAAYWAIRVAEGDELIVTQITTTAVKQELQPQRREYR